MPAKRRRYDNGQQCQLVLTNKKGGKDLHCVDYSSLMDSNCNYDTADDGDADDNNSKAENDSKAESDDGNNNNRRGLSLR